MKKDVYLRQMTQQINDRKVKDDIYSELQDCIDDFIEMYMEQGMTFEEAEAEAVKQMGSPKETGEMFNEVYRLLFEWKMIAYMLLWIIIPKVFFGVISLIIGVPAAGMESFTTLIGIVFLIVGVGLSYFEKTDDTPFLWFKVAPTADWAMPGLGVFTNSGTLAGIGIAAMTENVQQVIIIFGIIAVIFLLQRLYLTNEMNKNEKQYIYKECIALEDFDYKGHVTIDDETQKVQLRRGNVAKKGDMLLITGARGFTLIVENF